MAERRMFAKTIIDSDAFLDMPLSAQALYFHLSMRADDDGFVNNPKKIQRMVGASDDDCKLLLLKRFLITFESGIVVIKHWRIHNYIQKDRYKPTLYKREMAQLEINQNKAYTDHPQDRIQDVYKDVYTLDTDCIQDVSKAETQVRLGKYSIDNIKEIDKDNKLVEEYSIGGNNAAAPQNNNKKTFSPPKIEEVKAYCLERNNTVDAERFIDYYTANGWMVGKNKMKDWKAAVRTWERSTANDNRQQPQQRKQSSGNVFLDIAHEEGIL